MFALAGTAPAQAQSAIVATRIVAVPNGIYITVDGQTYATPITLLWPQGSSHTLHAFNQVALGTGTQYTFTAWSSNVGPIVSTTIDPTTIIVTADPNITQINANFTTQYQVQVSYFSCPGYFDPTSPCPASLSPGTVTVNGQSFTMNGSLYASGTVTLQATPNPGWVFNGWNSGLGNSSQAFQNSINVTGPITVAPIFVQGRTMTIQSSPTTLTVLADRTPVVTPANLTWGISTTHQLGSQPSQLDLQGKLWVFSSWSDGGSINHAYLVPNVTGAAITLTANFVAGQRVSFLTNPPGLTLAIDGSSSWLSDNFAWAVNSQHTVSAPQTQTDASGNVYTFGSWSQGGAATQTITATQDPNGLNLQYTANYTNTGPAKISVVSQASGVVIQVDGQNCALPCSINRPGGTSVHLTAPTTIAITGDSRLNFLGWGDSTSADRTLVAQSGPLTLTLNYSLQNHLTASVAPAEGASLLMAPAMTDGYFDSQSQVQVSAQTKVGFKFSNWDGDASGISPTISLSMNAPHSVRAILIRVPTLLDGAVQNSVGTTPLSAVSPGSIISIYGVNLASTVQVGPSSPLSQTLSNMTVSMNGELAPLLFVSPSQINAQVPLDLLAGTYMMVVHSDGNPDLTQSFTVARDAPGLFNTVVNGNAYGVFLHQDGSPVTSDSPAIQNETVSLLGTGFGPLAQTPLEGFPVAESPTSVLADSLTITLGDGTTVPSTYAGAADGKVGLDAVRFLIASPLPTGTTVNLKITVGTQDSNTVMLPLQ